MKKRKGFTLVELLVVISIIALLMAILMPALAKVRAIAYRLVCAANMAGIGKAMLAYANENNESYPISGLPGQNTWSTKGYIAAWYELKPERAFQRERPTITSCHFLINRTQEGTPKQSVCKGDVGARIFSIKESKETVPTGTELQNCWDFGGQKNWPGKYNSYAYQMPFYHNLVDGAPPRSFPILSSSYSGCPVMADRNPYNDKNADAYIDGRLPGETAPRWDPGDSAIPPHYADQYRTGNSACHQREGQNVLFNDNRATFEKFPNVGIDNDNIWKAWGTAQGPTDEQKQLGVVSPQGSRTDGYGGPRNERDAYLVSEDNRGL